MKMNKIFFNAHHSPMGAFASFTLGCKGAAGGLGQELTGSANQNLFIGIEQREGGKYQAFPFFDASSDASTRYDIEKEDNIEDKRVSIDIFNDDEIKRSFKVSTDEWSAGDMSFKVISPVRSIPDPDNWQQ